MSWLNVWWDLLLGTEIMGLGFRILIAIVLINQTQCLRLKLGKVFEMCMMCLGGEADEMKWRFMYHAVWEVFGTV